MEDTDEDCTSDEDEADAPIRLLAGDMDNAADDADQDLDDLLQPEAGGAPDDEKRLDLVSTLVAAARVAAARVAAALEEEPADCLFSSPPPAHHLEGKAGPRRAFTPAPVSLTPTSSAGPTTAVRVRNKSQPAKKTQKKRKTRKNPIVLCFARCATGARSSPFTRAPP